jgi:hypothetical protein
MDSTSNVAEALAHIKANCVNVAVSGAAAILYICLNTVEAVLEAVVDSIEAITESICDATELSVYILIVETFEEVRAGDSTLYCGIAIAISKDAASTKYSKPYKIDEPCVTG